MGIFERVKVTKVRDARGARSAMFVVSLDGVELGLLEKYRDTRTDTHPWKAFVGIGAACEFIDAWYGPGSRIKARNAVMKAAGVM